MLKEEAMQILDVSYSTLKRYVKKGLIRTTKYEMPGKRGKNNYWDEDVYALVGRRIQKGHEIAAYIRVNGSFKEDRAKLQEQRDKINMFAAARGLTVDRVYEDIAASTDFTEAKRPSFFELYRNILNGNVDAVIVDSKDRFTRIGWEILEMTFKHYGTDVLIINKAITDEYYQREQSEDLARLLAQAKIERISSE